MFLGRFKMFSKQQTKLQSYSKRTYNRFKYINPTLLNGRFRKEKKIIQNFDFFLILDFEATCEKNGTLHPQEIIEFPCLKMNSKTLEIESHFHQYVMPELNPVLTPFCVELTGILQEEAWKKIESKYNSQFLNKKTWQQLRAKYDNIKKSTKKAIATNKQAIIKTGGGPMPSDIITPVMEKAIPLLGSLVSGLDNSFDSDGQMDGEVSISDNDMGTIEMLVGQPNFVTSMELFEEWMAKEKLLHSKFALLTCGDWDLKVMFPAQCKLSGIAVPSYMKQWINIKKTYGEATGRYGHSLMAMLQSFNLGHVGRLHSGIDDCLNIANIVRKLAVRHTFGINGLINDS